jgi:acyl carrier protein
MPDPAQPTESAVPTDPAVPAYLADPVLDRIIRCVSQVLAKPATEIHPDSRLIDDLGADSLDLVELMYVLEDEFSIHLDKQDLSLSAQLGIPEEEVHERDVIKPKALALLRERYPQAHELLRDGVTRPQLATLLTVESLAAGLRNKLPAQDATEDVSHV